MTFEVKLRIASFVTSVCSLLLTITLFFGGMYVANKIMNNDLFHLQKDVTTIKDTVKDNQEKIGKNCERISKIEGIFESQRENKRKR